MGPIEPAEEMPAWLRRIIALHDEAHGTAAWVVVEDLDDP